LGYNALDDVRKGQQKLRATLNTPVKRDQRRGISGEVNAVHSRAWERT